MHSERRPKRLICVVVLIFVSLYSSEEITYIDCFSGVYFIILAFYATDWPCLLHKKYDYEECSEKKCNPLHWRHNDHDGVSNHQPHGCILNRLFRRRSKKTSKLRVTGLCVGNSPGPVNFPHKGPVARKMFPFDDVIMARFIRDVDYMWYHAMVHCGVTKTSKSNYWIGICPRRWQSTIHNAALLAIIYIPYG